MLSIQNDLRFGEILGENWEGMCHSAFSMARVQESFEVLIQKLFTDIWQSESKIEIKSTLKAYLLSRVNYKVMKPEDEIVQKRELEFQADKVPDFDQNLLEIEDISSQLEANLSKHSPKNQKVFPSTRLEVLYSEEIGKKLVISLQTVHNHLSTSPGLVPREARHPTVFALHLRWLQPSPVNF